MSSGNDIYDEIGVGYAHLRRPDPRIAPRIRDAIGAASSVVNVGAGAGSYEPSDILIVAVEPSAVMIRQRPAGSAVVVQAAAERLPFADDAFDVAMAILTVHHWTDPAAGIAELCRVSRRQVVMTWDWQHLSEQFWLNSEYLPEISAQEADLPAAVEITELLGGSTRSLEVPIPADCVDGFYAAFWARPESYLDPRVRAGMSSFALADQGVVARALDNLARDLESGVWDKRHSGLRELTEFDVGYRLLIAEED